jgi:hypothetical protein
VRDGGEQVIQQADCHKTLVQGGHGVVEVCQRGAIVRFGGATRGSDSDRGDPVACPLRNFRKNVVGVAQEKHVARGEEFGARIPRSNLRELIFAETCESVIDTGDREKCFGEVEEVTHADCFGHANRERADKNLLVVTSQTVDERQG